MPKYLVTATIPYHAESEVEASNLIEARHAAANLCIDDFIIHYHGELSVDGVHQREC